MGDVLCPAPPSAPSPPRAEVVLLAGPQGAPAARLLPGVDDGRGRRRPLDHADPPPRSTPRSSRRLAEIVAAHGIDEAVLLTSFHQSPLPTALLLRLAGVPRISGASVDYRRRAARRPPDPRRDAAGGPARARARAARSPRPPGSRCPPGDDGRLAVAPAAATPSPPAPVPTSSCTRVPPCRRGPPAGRARRGPSRRWPQPGTGCSSPAARPSGRSPPPSPAPRGLDLGGRLDLPRSPPCCAAPPPSSSATPARRTSPPRSAPRSSRSSPRSSRRSAGRPTACPSPCSATRPRPAAGTRARESARCPGHPCLADVDPADVVAAARAAARGGAR